MLLPQEGMNPLLAELTQPIKAAKAGLPKAREKVTQNDVPTQSWFPLMGSNHDSRLQRALSYH